MIATMYAAYVTCTLLAHEEDLYYVHCKGRKDLMESVAREMIQKDMLGGYCTPYKHEEAKDSIDFVVYCE